jgi:hypothetical protein
MSVIASGIFSGQAKMYLSILNRRGSRLAAGRGGTAQGLRCNDDTNTCKRLIGFHSVCKGE